MKEWSSPMSLIRASVVLASLVVLAACAQSPVPKGSAGIQGVLSGADKWNDLASQTAESVQDCLIGTLTDEGIRIFEPSCKKFSPDLKGNAIYIDQRGGGSIFDQSFHQMVTGELVKRGQNVTLNQDKAALRLAYRVYLVPRKGQTVPLNAFPGKYSAVAGGLGALSLFSNADLTFWQSALVFGSLGLFGDVFANSIDHGGEQIVITVALMKDDTYVMRRAGAYYIFEVDLAHYTSGAPVADLQSPRRKGAKAPKNRMFIGSPSSKVSYTVQDLGEVRIIF